MTLRKIPALEMNCEVDAEFGISPRALSRYQPLMADEGRDDENRITILDVIGEDYFGGVGAKQVAAGLRRVGDNDVHVTLNSPGGNYFEGLSIYNLLREHPYKVTIEIVGMAASAASVIAMAGDEIRIAKAGFMMIHNTWMITMGDRNDLRETADLMEAFDEVAVDLYADRTGKDAAELSTMLDKETWLSGKKAVEEGFADSNLLSDQSFKEKEASNSTNNLRWVDNAMARAGVPKSQRRERLKGLKQDMQDAVLEGTQDAAIESAATRFLEIAAKA